MKDDKLYLVHISECIQRIEAYIKEDKASFMENSMAQDAVLRNFEIIGEAVKSLSDSFKGKFPEIPWKKIAGFRDVLIHDYMGVDLDEVWNIIEQNLPDLKTQLKNMLKPQNPS